jgi:uncharacterized protein YjbJ (UPF0337 family)
MLLLRNTMKTNERFKAKVEKVSGAIQKAVGKAIGNENLQARGEAKEHVGVARQQVAKASERFEGKASERLKGAGDELKGAVKSFAGKVLGNAKMQAAGAVKKREGAARRELNR